MLSDGEYVLSQFKKNYGNNKDQKIVIYGIGERTREIIEKFPTVNIIGLMHFEKVGEEIYGKKILSFDEVQELGADYIIIIARRTYVRIIYQRIESECRKRKIILYDINRINLLEYYKVEPIYSEGEYPVNGIRLSALKEIIGKVDVVSFDIFDTLLMRKVLYPTDVFEVVGRRKRTTFDFKKARIKAEHELLSDNPNIYEIYHRLKENEGLSDELMNELFAEEILVENQVIVSRDDAVELLDYTYKQGKKVYLVSDMYLPKEILETILDDKGVHGYEDILISCEYRSSKWEGLFGILKNKVKCENIVHIGDNLEADILSAEDYGIKAFYLPKAYDMFVKSSFQGIRIYESTLENRLIIGMLLSKLFNSPFEFAVKDTRVSINSMTDIAYALISPLLVKYMYWFCDEIKEQKIDFVFFPARDGYLLEKLYQIMCKSYKTLPEGKYLYASRLLCSCAGAMNSEDVRIMGQAPYKGTVIDLLKTRFLVSKEEADVRENDSRTQSEIIEDNMEIILQKAIRIRKHYLDYLKRNGIDENGKLAFCDFSSSGTSQKNLLKLIKNEICGLYFTRPLDVYDKSKELLDIKSLYSTRTGQVSVDNDFIHIAYQFLELIITSPEPTVHYMDSRGAPVFYKETRSRRNIQVTNDMRAAIEEFTREYVLLSGKTSNSSIDLKLADTILSFIQNNFTCVKDNEILDFMLDDSCCNEAIDTTEIFQVV